MTGSHNNERGAKEPDTAGTRKHRSGCCGGHAEAAGSTKTARDPVCGMMVDPHATAHRAEHQGHPYYFCSAGCRTKFLADPARYLGPADARPVERVPGGTIYTCPMHPEVRQAGPGSCPICGMALEPETVSAEGAPNHELRSRTLLGHGLAVGH